MNAGSLIRIAISIRVRKIWPTGGPGFRSARPASLRRAPFAIMQLKAIFSVLLQNHEFELSQAPESYHNDHSKMVVQLAQPCTGALSPPGRSGSPITSSTVRKALAMRIEVDLDLCQDTACELEAPEVFEAHKDYVEILDKEPDESLRAEVRAAVQYCPTQAPRIVED